MFERSRLRTRISWTAVFVAVFLLSGVASAQQGLNKDEQKCVNSTNKNAQKIASKQGKEVSNCIKDGAKGKLGAQTIEECVTSDPKDKVAKAKTGFDDKVAKDCGAGSGFIFLADPEDTKRIAMEKELKIIHWIFGSDLDTGVITKETDKDDSKCQQAIAKAIFKCQDTKWKTYNACKKNALKAGKDPLPNGATSAQQLQDACLGTGTGSIPDDNGKLSKKCSFTSTIGKKCPDRDVFDGCPSPASDLELSNCIDQMIECELCLALNEIDGLGRACDLFDDEIGNGSCPDVGLDAIGAHMSFQDPLAICENGTNDGTLCTSAFLPPECTGGGECVPKASFLTTSNPLFGENGLEIVSLTESETVITCGAIDPSNGTAPCTSVSVRIKGQPIFPIGFLCFRPRPDLNCPAGLIDCDGGTPMDVDAVQKHNIIPDVMAMDPNRFPFPDCRANPEDVNDLSCFGQGSPDCVANQVCSDMCDLWCSSRGPAYKQEASGCEGICQVEDPDSPTFGATCRFHADCAPNPPLTLDDVGCSGGSIGASHAGSCQCECLAIGIGAPSRPGALRVENGLQAWIETTGPCDQLDIAIVLEPACTAFTTELSTATVLDAQAIVGNDWTAVPLMGAPENGCANLANSVTSGSRLVSHNGNFDSTIGDVVSRSITVAK